MSIEALMFLGLLFIAVGAGCLVVAEIRSLLARRKD